MIQKKCNFYVDINYPANNNKEENKKFFEKALNRFHRMTNESKILVTLYEKSFFSKTKKRIKK